MKRKIAISFVLFFITLSLFASLRSEMQLLTKKYKLSNASIGITVQRTKNGKDLYQYQSDKTFIPASNNKLFTAISALLALPPNFTFNTTIYIDPAKVHNKILNGNLYIQFTGDPSLTSSRLKALIQKLKTHGIDNIKGDVVLVANRFSGDLYPEGWSKSDMDYCYAAPSSSMNLNRNCMIISVDSAGDGKSEIKRLTNTQGVKIINQLTLVSGKKANSCQFKSLMTGENILYLTGCIPNQAHTRMSFAISNPALKTLDMVTDILNNDHIDVSGSIAIGNLPNKLTPIVKTNSSSLDQMIKHMLLHSDNLYAESIAKSIGFYVNGIGSTPSASEAMTSTLQNDLKLNTKRLILKDGSGLSHFDKTTPNFLATMLTKAFNNKQIGKRLYRELPISGISGTIKYRMNSKSLLGKVRAKTGTLDGTIALSGYVVTKQKHRLSFSIMINDLNKNQRRSARAFQNAAVQLFYNYL